MEGGGTEGGELAVVNIAEALGQRPKEWEMSLKGREGVRTLHFKLIVLKFSSSCASGGQSSVLTY